jgi:hypothetical protein|tara:strand:- start:1976 stop:2407 length:432 start_codon:yes stop_codon:yes gene_type:complete
MKNKLFLLLVFIVFPSLTLADHHGLSLEARQERTIMTVTSIEVGDELTILNAEGTMGEYGKVYASYKLSYDSSRNGGTYTAEGRGFIDTNTMASGTAMGIWRREGSKVYMEELVNINDGTQNLGRIVFDALENTMIMDVYIIH